jgi:hypothetical protein
MVFDGVWRLVGLDDKRAGDAATALFFAKFMPKLHSPSLNRETTVDDAADPRHVGNDGPNGGSNCRARGTICNGWHQGAFSPAM